MKVEKTHDTTMIVTQCDEKVEIYTSHLHWIVRGTTTFMNRDEVNRREVCVLDGIPGLVPGPVPGNQGYKNLGSLGQT